MSVLRGGFLLLALAPAACGGSGGSGPAAPTFPTTVVVPGPQPRGVSGAATDAVTDQPLGGVLVRVEGLGDTTTAANGSFRFDAADPEQVRALSATSSLIVEPSR